MSSMATYRPADAERAALFARYKRAKTLIADNDEPVKKAAVKEMHAGATTKQLAEATGLSEETLRQLARGAGVARKRPPTVGRDARR
jgi:threonine dehydrogenase-like Zn-dependent dehydrogenase